MVRRSFRRGLRLGLLVGALFALAKLVQSRRLAEESPSHVTPPAPWPPRPTSAPAPAVTPTVPEPVVDAAPPAAAVEAPPRRERPADKATRPAKKAAKKAAPAQERIWVEPSGNTCPPSHPIKAKLASKLFHLPGMFAYERCKPDRCYGTEEGAIADGLTKAKR